MFLEKDYLEDTTDIEEENCKSKEIVQEGIDTGNVETRKKFGVDSRIVMTFYQGKFLYTERAVNIMMCSTFKDCSYVYSVKAWFFTTYFPPLID